MYFDRFDIVEAHYMFYSHYHEGQFSDGYRKLSHILSQYRPSPFADWSDENNLNENARAIYDNLVKKYNKERE
jgi:hypothetical protein